MYNFQENRTRMQLYLIRHTQSENNALWYKTGSSDGRSEDPALTEIGHQQAEHLAAFMAGRSSDDSQPDNDSLDRDGIRLTHLYCSLMRRSIQTGLAVAERLDLPLVALENIHERGGIYLANPATRQNEGLPGPNRDQFEAQYPELILPDSLGAEGWWNRPYETIDASIERAGSVVDWLLTTHDNSDDRVAMIIHGGFIQSLFSVLFQMPLLENSFSYGRDVWVKANNGSITRIDFLAGTIRLTYQNRIEFIPEHLVT
jgi:2,3-bisphosphoglycerate-dependent phosphoglycerate mutase